MTLLNTGIELCLQLLGLISTAILILAWFWLGNTLRILLMCKFRGGTCAWHIRGLYANPIRIDKGIRTYTYEDKGKSSNTWVLEERSMFLLPGNIPSTILIDGIAKSFNPTQIFEIVSAHIENLKRFGVVEIGDNNEVIKDKEGNPIVHYPVDPRSPSYVMPKLLSSKNLAEQIKIEGSKQKERLQAGEKYQTLAIVVVLVAAAVAIVGIKLGLDYQMCQPLAKEVVKTTTTTLIDVATSTASTLAPPPMV